MNDRLVYLLKFPGGIYKIGITANMHKRLTMIAHQSQKQGYGKPMLLHTLTCEYYLARVWESFFHQAYKCYRIRPFEMGSEYFRLPAHEVEMICSLPDEIDFKPSHFYLTCLGIKDSRLLNHAAWLSMRARYSADYEPRRPILTPKFVARVKYLDALYNAHQQLQDGGEVPDDVIDNILQGMQ